MSIHTKAALNTIASFVLALILFLIVLAISNKHDHTYDATQNKRLSLSEQSLRLVQGLKKPVRAVVFTNDYQVKSVEKVLDKYKVANPAMFSYRVLDPLKNPGAAKAYAVQYSGQGVLELVEPDQAPDQPGKRQERLSDLEEQTITSALLKLSERSELKIGFLTGHGERSITEQQPMGLSILKSSLEPEAFHAEEFSLAKKPQVPADYAAVVLAAPRSALLDSEKEGLLKYLDQGGRLLLEYDIHTDPSYATMLKAYGFDIPDEIILCPDKYGRFTQDSVLTPGLPVAPQHPAVKDQKDQVVLYLAHPIKVGDPNQANGYAAQALISSIDGCLAVPVEAILKNTLKVDTSRTAAFPLVTVSSKKMAPAASPSPDASPSPAPGQDRESRLAVVGGEMFSNQVIRAAGNRDLTLNLLSWLVQAESRISIRPSEETSKPLMLAPGALDSIVLVQLLLIPAIFLLIGILSAVRRR